MTQLGNDSLREELKMLISKDRPEVINAIASAREFGDLKENAEYHAAKEKQSFIEGRISEIESKLSNAEIIDVTKLDIREKVVFGSTVKLRNMDSKSIVKYKIVGEDEADIDNGLEHLFLLLQALMEELVVTLSRMQQMDMQKLLKCRGNIK